MGARCGGDFRRQGSRDRSPAARSRRACSAACRLTTPTWPRVTSSTCACARARAPFPRVLAVATARAFLRCVPPCSRHTMLACWPARTNCASRSRDWRDGPPSPSVHSLLRMLRGCSAYWGYAVHIGVALSTVWVISAYWGYTVHIGNHVAGNLCILEVRCAH